MEAASEHLANSRKRISQRASLASVNFDKRNGEGEPSPNLIRSRSSSLRSSMRSVRSSMVSFRDAKEPLSLQSDHSSLPRLSWSSEDEKSTVSDRVWLSEVPRVSVGHQCKLTLDAAIKETVQLKTSKQLQKQRSVYDMRHRSLRCTLLEQGHDINCQEWAVRLFGKDAIYAKLPRSDQVRVLRTALQDTRWLIDPNSDYMKYWDMVLVVALFFTAFFTPYEVALLKADGNLLNVDLIFDIIYLKDLLMQFFLKVKVDSGNGYVWLRSRRRIARNYLRTWFPIDFFSILPYDEIAKSLEGGGGLDRLRMLRLLKCLRLLKLARILNGNRIVKRNQNRFGIRTGNVVMIKCLCLILISCHWFACVWASLGKQEGKNLRCREDMDPDDTRLIGAPSGKYFFDKTGSDTHVPSAWEGQSWIVKFAADRAAGTPLDPCNSFGIYIASLYWAVMTITSIGYGDIVPVTPMEYVVCTVCMLTSSLIWAYILCSATAVMTNCDPVQMDFEHRLDQFNIMAAEKRLPHTLRVRGREYIREARYHEHAMRSKRVVDGLGDELVCDLAARSASQYFAKIWIFKSTSILFQEALVNRLEPRFCEKGEVIDQFGKLCIVEHGSVGCNGRILTPYQFWGDDFIVRMLSLREQHACIAISHTELMTLSREDLNMALVAFPDELPLLRRKAVIMALRGAVKYIRRRHQCIQNGFDFSPRPDLSWLTRVFETAQGTESIRVRRKTELKSPRALTDYKFASIGQVEPTDSEVLRMIMVKIDMLLNGQPAVGKGMRSLPGSPTNVQGSPTNSQDAPMAVVETLRGQMNRLEQSMNSAALGSGPPMIQDFQQLQDQLNRIEANVLNTRSRSPRCSDADAARSDHGVDVRSLSVQQRGLLVLPGKGGQAAMTMVHPPGDSGLPNVCEEDTTLTRSGDGRVVPSCWSRCSPPDTAARKEQSRN